MVLYNIEKVLLLFSLLSLIYVNGMDKITGAMSILDSGDLLSFM